LELLAYFKDFFVDFRVFPEHQTDDLRILFKLCRLIKGSIEWIKGCPNPYILFEDLASLKGAANAVEKLLKIKHRFDLEYFDFID
jgi:hypothetical protein